MGWLAFGFVTLSRPCADAEIPNQRNATLKHAEKSNIFLNVIQYKLQFIFSRKELRESG